METGMAGSRLGEINRATDEANALKIKKAARVPYWPECGLEEKIERVRQALLSIECVLTTAFNTGREAKRIAKVHQHAPDGRVLMPFVEHSPFYESEPDRLELRQVFEKLR